MGLPDFLKNKTAKLDEQMQKKKADFRQKSLDLLAQIKALNEDRYKELATVFHQRYDKMNVQKKKIQGFYAQLVEELRKLKADAGETIGAFETVVKTTKKKINKVIDRATREVAKEAENVKKEALKVKAEVEKEAARLKKEVESEVAKVTKKVTKKVAPAAKKTAKKTVKKEAPKTVAKTAAKKSSAKKTTAKKSGCQSNEEDH